ncbi:hypothetical protein L209DRAFT_480016 [Thermothelomyces heterothallicus CBS 203.75]
MFTKTVLLTLDIKKTLPTPQRLATAQPEPGRYGQLGLHQCSSCCELCQPWLSFYNSSWRAGASCSGSVELVLCVSGWFTVGFGATATGIEKGETGSHRLRLSIRDAMPSNDSSGFFESEAFGRKYLGVLWVTKWLMLRLMDIEKGYGEWRQ